MFTGVLSGTLLRMDILAEELPDVRVNVRGLAIRIIIVARRDDEIRVPALDEVRHRLHVGERRATEIRRAVITDDPDGHLRRPALRRCDTERAQRKEEKTQGTREKAAPSLSPRSRSRC